MKKALAAVAVGVAVAGLIALAILGRELYRPFRAYAGTVTVEIAPGTSPREMARILVERGVLAHPWPFLARYALGRTRHTLKAGEYHFDRPLGPVDVYWKLVHGEVALLTVLVPEGSDRFDMARIFEERLGLDPHEFLRVTELAAMIRDLDPQAPTLEGYLYPDTYRFARNATPAQVVETMLARFRQVLGSKFSADLEQPGASLHRVVTLASLVEMETPDRGERPTIAGIFEKRLKIGLPLACDPTVIYAARLDHRMLERPLPSIKQSDLQFGSPYNTYLHTGLPPGPIASPGESSLRAALRPASGDYLYFVSNSHGGHIFAGTLAEHLQNVARYRRQLAELRRLASQQTTFSERNVPETNRGGNGTKKKSSPRAKR